MPNRDDLERIDPLPYNHPVYLESALRRFVETVCFAREVNPDESLPGPHYDADEEIEICAEDVAGALRSFCAQIIAKMVSEALAEQHRPR